MLLIAAAVIATGLAASVAGIVVWARRQAAAQARTPDPRLYYIDLASRAAADASGRSLLVLLQALDAADEECPVTVDWVRHQPAREGALPGLMLRITWDGNEWRRALESAPYRERLQAFLAAEPGLQSRGAERLLDALAA